MRILFFIIISLATLQAQRLKIGVYYNQHVSSILISPYIGSYCLYGDSLLIKKININETIMVGAKNDSVVVRTVEKVLGSFKKIFFKADSNINVLKYKAIYPSLEYRYYDDEMTIYSNKNELNFVNEVDFEDYICGVVETESGYNNPIEFYKAHAVISRTFALENLSKHYTEGFHMCDGVHCQAYKGKNFNLSYHSIIYSAVLSTRNLVIVDTSMKVINAAYHANCGGQTVNSEDVWGAIKTYLRSVKDPYCNEQRNTTWEKKIEYDDFLNYIKTFDSTVDKVVLFNQTERKPGYPLNNSSISLRRIREKYNLKSTFFSIDVEGDSVVFRGKGIGHGVGLCQDGAIQMAKRGFNYADIIKFYYTGVKIVDYHSLFIYKDIFNQ